jgi:hypothetical protein
MSNDSEGPMEERGVLAHLFGVWYPKHYVVGIVEDRSSADRAADALRIAWRDAGAPSEEGVADQDYQRAVSQGHNVLAVLAPTPEAVERDRAVLADFNVRHLRYYGPLAVTDLRIEAE